MAEMDRLARNAMLARQANMSYGKWKAMQPIVEVDKKAIPEGWRVCEHCGKPFKPRTKQKQRYCEFVCQQRAYYWKTRKKGGACNG